MSNKPLATVFHAEIQGKRNEKYEYLLNNSIASVQWQQLDYKAPYHFFVPKDFKEEKEYELGLKIEDLMRINSNGIETQKDELNIFFTEEDSNIYLNMSKSLSLEEMISKYNMIDGTEWKSRGAVFDLKNNISKQATIQYRPFDYRITNYTGKTNGIMARPRAAVMNNIVYYENYGLCTMRQFANNDFSFCLITKVIIDNRTFYSNRGKVNLFPLYLYPNPEKDGMYANAERTPNLNMEIVNKIAEGLGLEFVPEKEETPLNLPKGETLSHSSSTPPSGDLGGSSSLVASSPSIPLSKSDKPRYVTADPQSYRFIKDVRDELKTNPTEAEKLLWSYLSTKQTGHKIRKQHIIDTFIADFVCILKKTIIEIDGSIHDERKEYDQARTDRLNHLGYDVIRFTNDEVMSNPKLVAEKIKVYLDSKEETPLNLPKGETLRHTSSTPPSGDLGGSCFAPIDILDYIYAVLHSPTYRETYKEFLKIDFPRVPYPHSLGTGRDLSLQKFWKLVQLGGEIRQIHLLESPIVEDYITEYPEDGTNEVEKIKYVPNVGTGRDLSVQDGKVFINSIQYFDNVPEVAWNFYIGGYQPAQKWLKDRKGRILNFDDILHYQKIIVALTETDRLMKAVDEVIKEEGE